MSVAVLKNRIQYFHTNCVCCKSLADKIPARLVLYFLSLSGFLVSFMMRNDMNFAIVTITNQTENTNKQWSPGVQSAVLGSFYWCFVLCQLVSGIATKYFGPKTAFGWSQFTTAACSLCIPWVVDFHYGFVIGLRSLQGFASGITFPAMFTMIGTWIPFVERSKFMSSIQGFNIGIGLTYPICGFIIQYYSWHYVFVTTGSLGMIWCFIWYILAFSTPRQHPRITAKELKYIEDNLYSVENHNNNDSKYVPWKAIICSLPVWSIAITTFGRIWVQYVFIVSGPKFMDNVFHFKYETNGFVTGLPFICSYFSAFLFCYVADKLVLRYSLTLVRKIFSSISQVIPGILLLIVGYVGNNVVLVLFLWFISVIMISAAYAGAMANIVDLAPNYAGQVLAFSEMIHMTASFLSQIAAYLIVTKPNFFDQWRIVFIVASVIACTTYLFYLFFGTAEVQWWNFMPQKKEILS